MADESVQTDVGMDLVRKHVEAALVDMRESLDVDGVHSDGVTVATGRVFPNGDPVRLRVWALPSRPNSLVVSDGGLTYVRVAENDLASPDLALSVRYDMLRNLPVQDIAGQVVVYTRPSGLAEALGMVADACLFLDTAILVAAHMRPRPQTT